MTTHPRPFRETEIAVVGGGLGAVAAALAAARAGRRVLLAAPGDRLGGQATTQLVPALDEHPHVETGGISRSYRAFRDLIRGAYDGLANPGDGWVSRLCFEPGAAERALGALLAPYRDDGRLTVLTGLVPHRVIRDGDRIASVLMRRAGGAGGAEPMRLEVRADLFLDATEAGVLLPLAGADWVAGSEGTDGFGESLALPGGPKPEAVQSCTVGFVVEHVPGEDHTAAAPDGYERLRDGQPFTLEIGGWDGRTHRYRMFEEGPDGHLPFWTYRRLRSGALLGGRDAALINWAGNDYAGSSSLADPHGAYTRAKALSAAFLHWLRTECPRDDGTGRGYPGLRLAPEVAGTADGFAAEAYLRESRRLRGRRTVREQDLLPVPGSARAAGFADAGGVALYHLDLHARVGHPTSAYAPTAPFQVPLSALAATEPVNLLAAAKNLAATQVAAAAYRVHHGEWAVGEASGALAAHCVARSRTPARVLGDRKELTRLQRHLTGAGVPLAWLLDVPPGGGDPQARAAHLLAAAGGLAGPRAAELTVRPADPATGAELTALHRAACTLLGEERLDAAGPVGDAADAGRPPGTWGEAARALGDVLDRALGPVDAPAAR
ncbi:FAD-dependent oxidoreductase [Streptomyces sp. MAR4 CNX-425]|uniref:FAD-dependent oxidoreductase n=1 Tax=Streptomyces sp. MAR4 CNX-425 TaxID=3406343 RepID=UPI003B501BD2